MKDKILAYVIMIGVVIGVIANTIFLEKQIEKISQSVVSLNISDKNYGSLLSEAKNVYDDFKKTESYISLTVNHNDLTNIEGLFSEMIGYIGVDDRAEALVTKNRLLDSLEHLRRLSGFNIDAII